MNPQRDVEIVGRHLEVAEALETNANEIADRLCVHDSGISRTRVEREREGHAKSHRGEFIAEGHVDDRSDPFDASAQGDDLYAAISELGRKLDRLISTPTCRKP